MNEGPIMITWFFLAILSLGVVGGVAAQSDEADAVKRVLDDYVKALNAANLDGVLSTLADDAQIDSLVAGAKVSKAKYAESMKQAFATGRVSQVDVRGLKVAFPKPDRATVDGQVGVRSPGSNTSLSASHQWQLEKRDGKWLVIETKYKSQLR
jgi:uncharacterized protein (TIGR02246 family)